MINFWVKRKEIEELKEKLLVLENENLEQKQEISKMRQDMDYLKKINEAFRDRIFEYVQKNGRKISEFESRYEQRAFKDKIETIRSNAEFMKKAFKLD